MPRTIDTFVITNELLDELREKGRKVQIVELSPNHVIYVGHERYLVHKKQGNPSAEYHVLRYWENLFDVPTQLIPPLKIIPSSTLNNFI